MAHGMTGGMRFSKTAMSEGKKKEEEKKVYDTDAKIRLNVTTYRDCVQVQTPWLSVCPVLVPLRISLIGAPAQGTFGPVLLFIAFPTVASRICIRIACTHTHTHFAE